MGLMGHTNRNMVDSGAEDDLNLEHLAQEKNVSMFPRGCSSDILVKNVNVFCPCLISLLEGKVSFIFYWQRKSQNSLVLTVVWLLTFTLVKIYNGKKQAEQGKMQNVQFEEKKNTRK